jgi:hypothetical protein
MLRMRKDVFVALCGYVQPCHAAQPVPIIEDKTPMGLTREVQHQHLIRPS